MKAFKLGVQLHSVRNDAAKDTEGTLRAIKAMGYDGVELAGLYGKTPEEMKALAAEIGLEIISAHTGLWETRGMGAKAVAEQSTVEDTAVKLVFVTELLDTRFDPYSVLRPLDSAQLDE